MLPDYEIRPRRSALYMPGSNTRALEKARSLPADMLILDLEDSVAPDAKEMARKNIAKALAEGGYGAREVLVRVNSLETPWGATDLAAMAEVGADGILVPKVEAAETVSSVIGHLNRAGAPADLSLWCMIETPFGVLRAEAIAGAALRVAGLVIGTADLAKDLHCLHTPDRLPFVTSLSLAVLAARAYRIAVLDGPHFDLEDAAGFEASCQQALQFGFDGKTLIHPKTIEIANRIFAPTPEAVAQAKEIVAAFKEAEAAGLGVTVLNGRLVESLHVEDARRVLALAEKIAQREPNSVA